MSIDVSAVSALPGALSAKPQDIAPQRAQRVDVMRTEPPVSMDAILGELVDVSAAFNKRLSFSINEKLDQVVVKVIDTDTDKVIREIPPTELQHVHERIKEVLGILFDERA
ncbi:MAG: flagellar protein FlaG [Spirochaetes bacterium]|nr:flagellar protein FlaG [Spirochaetota bacterium]MBU1080216.1 flagellar protein FlaG [Spirochaetota bacterium]